MTDTVTNPENVTANASPRPWRVAYNRRMSNWLVVNANGTVISAAWREEDAALIVDAVNERVHLLNVLSEEQEHGYLMEEERDRLRDIVRRLYKSLQDAADVIRADTEFIGPFAPDVILCGVDIAELLREARAAIGEDSANG